jgi:hypothetical protein
VIEGKPGYYPKVTWYYADAELVTAEAKEHARGDGHAGRSKGNDHRIDETIIQTSVSHSQQHQMTPAYITGVS